MTWCRPQDEDVLFNCQPELQYNSLPLYQITFTITLLQADGTQTPDPHAKLIVDSLDNESMQWQVLHIPRERQQIKG